MHQPIIFSPTHPMILRPKFPIGFTIETAEGVVIVDCSVDYQDARFHVTQGPTPDTAAVTFETTWFEHPAD